MRKSSIVLAGLAMAGLVGAASARDRDGRAPVQLAPGLAAEWILQLSPGSGVVPGYQRPRFERPVVLAPASGVVVGAPVLVRHRQGGYVGSIGHAPSAVIAPHGVQRLAVAGQSRPVTRSQGVDSAFLPQEVEYRSRHKAGTVVIDTTARFLYLVGENGRARRYGVGVGKPGFEWAGTHRVTQKREWPSWTPPSQMIARERKKGRVLPAHMKGGPENPLGARAMYLGSTLYRIHGTNQPWTIGRAVSSGCIRMRNEDVIELYQRVKVGTKVVVL